MGKKYIRHNFFSGLCLLSFFMPVLFPVQMAFAGEYKKLLFQGIDTFNCAYNEWDVNQFRSSLALFNEAIKSGKKDGLAEYWAGTVYFFLAQHDLFTEKEPTDKKQGIENTKRGIEILSKSIELSPDFSESYALRGVLRGILIKIKPSSVFTQGPKVGKDRDRALSLDRFNPRVHYLTGVSYWYAPEILGGRDKALEHLLEAESLFEKEAQHSKDKLLPSWGRSTCLAFIGDIFLDQKQNKRAYDYYKKALDVNPVDPLALRGIKILESLKSNK
jgi:tetratricopeptide (TPR) repeat protein